MALSPPRRVASVLALVGTFFMSATAAASPKQVAEFSLHARASQPKWVPEEHPLFGDYLASGEGEGSGPLIGHFLWDLYEDQSRDDRHPAFFRGFVEREGRRHSFEIIGVYVPVSADRRRWQLSGAITFADALVLGTIAAQLPAHLKQTLTPRITQSGRRRISVEGKRVGLDRGRAGPSFAKIQKARRLRKEP
jgi:hypothetical protein